MENCPEYSALALSPVGADSNDEKMMGTMAEFICRANYGLNLGCFEFDLNDGEIRYKYAVDCTGITPSQEIVGKSVILPVLMFRRYGSGIVDIVFRNASAKEAIKKCEEPSQEILKALLERKPE